MVLRLSLPDGSPDPTYGGQLQDFSISGHVAEGRVRVDWEEFEVPLDGDAPPARLRRPPTWSVVDTTFGPPPHPDMTVSPRIAPPQMIGLGLLEAIPAADILAWTDPPEDVDGDGVSGRANVVWSVEYDQPMLGGRFGLKAATPPTVREQSAAAFSGDIGISTPPLFPAAWGGIAPRHRADAARPPRMAMVMFVFMRWMTSASTSPRYTAATWASRPVVTWTTRRCCAANKSSMTPAAPPVTARPLSPTAWPTSHSRAFS